MGIDVSKETLDIVVGGNYKKIKNTKDAITNFIKLELASLNVVLCALESTGGYEKIAIMALNKAGIKVHRAHPNKVYAFAKACNHFVKTDKLDAILLEKYAIFIKAEEFKEIILDEKQLELQSLRSLERNLQNNLHAYQCRAQCLNTKALKYTLANC